MGSAWFVTLDREVPEVDLGMDGRALALNENQLSSWCEAARVTPLLTFLSPAIEQQRLVLESFGMDDIPLVAEQWFEPEDGLRTVTTLRDIVPREREWLVDFESLARDLERVEEILRGAHDAGARWHFDVDL